MQAALAGTGLHRLGIVQFAREYPARRSEDRPGFIDFLGVDRQNRLHVVETKVGTSDVRVVLQALDYATWVSANGAAIREERNWPDATGEERVVIDFVLAPKSRGAAVGRYFEGQVEALDGGLAWTVTIVKDPLAESPEPTGPYRRRVPDNLGALVATPVQPARWVNRIARELARDTP